MNYIQTINEFANRVKFISKHINYFILILSWFSDCVKTFPTYDEKKPMVHHQNDNISNNTDNTDTTNG